MEERKVPAHCGECDYHQPLDERCREFCGLNGRRIWADDPERPLWCPLAEKEASHG